MGSVTSIVQRRRLTDLYIKGKPLELNDDTEGEESIVVWISKISPLENQESSAKANAVRAAILANKYVDDTDETRRIYLDQISEIDKREDMINFLIAPRLQELEISHQSQLASEDKWAKDNYYESLLESWNSDMRERYEADNKDVEAKKVYTELMKFVKEVEKRVEADKEDLIGEYEIRTDAELRSQTIDRLIEAEADYAWLNEYRKWQVFYATREFTDHKKRYFLMKEEVDSLDPRITGQIISAYLELQVDSLEGKGSEETSDS
jgi:hypothetical protein